MEGQKMYVCKWNLTHTTEMTNELQIEFLSMNMQIKLFYNKK